jgi:hypothetical protein
MGELPPHGKLNLVSDIQPNAELGSTLRDRIAAVLYEQSIRRARMSWQWKDVTHPEVRKRWLEDADAVIAVLIPEADDE